LEPGLFTACLALEKEVGLALLYAGEAPGNQGGLDPRPYLLISFPDTSS
jgi:hypothetical protein